MPAARRTGVRRTPPKPKEEQIRVSFHRELVDNGVITFVDTAEYPKPEGYFEARELIEKAIEEEDLISPGTYLIAYMDPDEDIAVKRFELEEPKVKLSIKQPTP